MRSVRLETDQMEFRGITANGGSPCEVVCQQLQRLLQPVPGELDEAETVERNGQFYILRYLPEDKMNENLARNSRMIVAPRMERLLQAGRPLKLTVAQSGRLDSLQFVDDATLDSLGEDEVEVEIRLCGLNFLDVLTALGEIPRSKIGIEAPGIVRAVGSNVVGYAAGDRVLVFALGVIRTVFRANPSSLHKIPPVLSLEDAGSIPNVAYTTAYHALVELARLQPGESILIHAAAGGLGQALINIAKMLGAQIYCTEGNEAKRQAIVALGVLPDNIFSFRSLLFEKGIMRVTGGRGVDVIVNSLAGEALRRSWLCLAAYGRFIEVGKMDLMSNSTLEMRHFLTGTTFAGCNLEHMLIHDPQRVAALLSKVMQLFDSGAVEPVRPIAVHNFTNVKQAFRELQRGRQIGKLILSVTPDSHVPIAPPTLVDMKLKANATYLLVGGFGGLGRGQALFMAEHGARYLAFISRSGDASSDAQAVIKSLSEQCVQYGRQLVDAALHLVKVIEVSDNTSMFR
ncbi:hypothetical protein JX266_013894 [Neoarthrinium moseri]|nr:hypothetical protein JX266_013894 [Neoarthrinium moseri]